MSLSRRRIWLGFPAFFQQTLFIGHLFGCHFRKLVIQFMHIGYAFIVCVSHNDTFCRANSGTKSTVHALGHVNIERSEEHTSELQSLMRISYAVFCLKKKKNNKNNK